MSPRPAPVAEGRRRPPSAARRARRPAPAERGRDRLEALLALEGEMRDAASPTALHDTTSRGLARLFDATAVLLLVRPLRRWKAVAASPARAVDRRSPRVRAVERSIAEGGIIADAAAAIEHPSGRTMVVRADRSAAVVALPSAPTPADGAILRRALATHAHAADALARVPTALGRRVLTRPVAAGAAALAVATLAVPVPLTVLAEAEIVGRAPYTVAAPMDGVVRALLVGSQATVRAGDPLVALDDTIARGARDLAARELVVAETRLARASDIARRADLPVLRAERDLAAVRLENAEAQLARTLVRAAADGVAVIDEPDAWAGRPVRTGERILRLVDPADVEAAISIAPADLIDLPDEVPVTIHLDAAPLNPRVATLRRIAGAATERPDGSLAHEARATLDRPVRLGARGIARLSGERVPLAYLVLRRPIGILRRATGW